MNEYFKKVEDNTYRLGARVTRYQGVHPIRSAEEVFCAQQPCVSISCEDSIWNVHLELQTVEDNPDCITGEIKFNLTKGAVNNANISLMLCLEDWNIENYVLMPAAVYNGNRFKVSTEQYPPMFTEKDKPDADMPVTITDVPRLSCNGGMSRIQLLAGDLATPAIGIFDPKSRKGLLLLTTQDTILGDSGISLEEAAEQGKAVITISAPGVRHDYKYSMCNTHEKSDDAGYNFAQGDLAVIRFRIYIFNCEDITGMFNYFMPIRKAMAGISELKHEIPFSEAWRILEKKYNERNWLEEYGFYRTAEVETSIFRHWQTGWVGGGINTYPCFFAGNGLSRKRAWRTLDFMFDRLQAKTGFFYGIFCGGKPYGDDFHNHDNQNYLLLRKNADAIYFLTKQFMLLDRIKYAQIPEKWIIGLKKACDAFVRLWNRYGQFGQFIDIGREEIIAGNTASAGIAPAGLALAGVYYREKEYLQVATQAAEHYYTHFIKKGVTNGGPGEILQCPDSESAFGLLESFVILYEVSEDEKWLRMAEDAAAQCASWCVSYDFRFPGGSEFARLGMQTTGAVWANVQNKHAAPGICTLSGVSLFKLFRATGNKLYLELLKDIAHSLPRYISRADRPIRITWDNAGGECTNAVGRVNERINMSDWEGKQNIGAISDGSATWCEINMMLTYVEVPGVYIQMDKGFVFTIDHIDAHVVENNGDALIIELRNPTEFTAYVNILAENSEDVYKALGENLLLNCTNITLHPDECKILTFYK